ncbi:hypothetical protein [Methylobacterium sp. WL7]|uniref:hypothetical protein n=1 Tax=Methylobacterium sp. WL7 TaxID=2603900 RepID=UPI0011CA6FE7|nr:hypothetical protein [Methylobacterium sp. WL7]TXN41375.1 hypothetical protein FV233_25235 [Methylobacterium sp. WL7]
MNAISAVSVRHNRHDGNVAPFVSIGRVRPDLQPVLPVTARTSTQISAERDAAQAEREMLEASRADVLLNGTSDNVAALDHRIALTKIQLDQLEMQQPLQCSPRPRPRLRTRPSRNAARISTARP